MLEGAERELGGELNGTFWFFRVQDPAGHFLRVGYDAERVKGRERFITYHEDECTLFKRSSSRRMRIELALLGALAAVIGIIGLFVRFKTKQQ